LKQLKKKASGRGEGTKVEMFNDRISVKFHCNPEYISKIKSISGYRWHPRLPVVLSQKEVSKLLSSTNNVKHKLILMFMYSSGLRVGGVVKLGG